MANSRSFVFLGASANVLRLDPELDPVVVWATIIASLLVFAGRMHRECVWSGVQRSSARSSGRFSGDMGARSLYSLAVMSHDPLTSSDWSATSASRSSGDSTPKWFTEVEIDLRERWTESTIEYVPTVDYEDSWFTRVEFTTPSAPAIPGSIPAA